MPDNIWNNIFQFQTDLAIFFKQNGLETDIVSTIEGSNGLRVIIIRKGPAEPATLQNPKGPQLSANPSMGKAQKSKQIVRNLTKQLKGGMR